MTNAIIQFFGTIAVLTVVGLAMAIVFYGFAYSINGLVGLLSGNEDGCDKK